MNTSAHRFALVLGLACLLSAGCGKSVDPEAGKSSAGEAKAAEPAAREEAKSNEGVTLTQEQLEKLGATTQPAQTAEYREETPGYAVVLDHQTLSQAVADVQTAQASARFSKSSLERARGLQGTPGAVSADLEQTAEQKAAVDNVALTLTTAKLAAIWGRRPPWNQNVEDPRVQSLARGDLQLVRATFPLGSLPAPPDELRGGRVGTSRPDAAATLRPVWQAPADTNIPGHSFYAVLAAGTVAEGEHLQVWAPTGKPTAGALIPSSAVVMNAGKYWCYVEKEPRAFVRVEIDTTRAMNGGFFVTAGVKPGDRIAVTAASQLLAKETGSSEEPD